MPVGGGDPKVIGDGNVVKIRPEFTRGNCDVWDLRDVVVALLEEREDLRTALAGAATYADFQIAVAALPRWVQIIDSLNNNP
jgi:hypothetical protein